VSVNESTHNGKTLKKEAHRSSFQNRLFSILEKNLSWELVFPLMPALPHWAGHIIGVKTAGQSECCSAAAPAAFREIHTVLADTMFFRVSQQLTYRRILKDIQEVILTHVSDTSLGYIHTDTGRKISSRIDRQSVAACTAATMNEP
jgi:hypothetical protein